MVWTPRQIPQSQHEHRPSGYILLDGQEVAHTKQCVHCARHFVSIKGSGTIRGHCLRCNGITCGRPACDPCRPWEQQMEHLEAADRRIILP